MQWSPDANGAVASSEEEVLERPVAELADELRNLTDERHGWRESALTRRLNHKRPSDHDEERDRDDAGGSDDGAGRRGTEREQAMLMGTVVHSALEDLISGDDSDTIARTVLMHAEAKHLDKERRPQAERLVQQGLACGITKRAEEAEKCWREVSVREIDEGRPGGLTITSCICDLLFEDDGGFVLADYKTDDLAVADVDERVARYTPQLETYARALRISTGTLVREAWLLFLNTDGPPLEKKVDLGERTAPERDDEPRAGEGP